MSPHAVEKRSLTGVVDQLHFCRVTLVASATSSRQQRLLSTTVAKGRCQLQESMTGLDGKGQQLLCQRRAKTKPLTHVIDMSR